MPNLKQSWKIFAINAKIFRVSTVNCVPISKDLVTKPIGMRDFMS